MLINILINIFVLNLSLYVIFLIGCFARNILFKQNNFTQFSVTTYLYGLIFFLLYISICALIVPLDIKIIFLLCIILIFAFLIAKKPVSYFLNAEIKNIIYYFSAANFIFLILIFTDIGFTYDALNYHLSLQHILHDEPIRFGLFNINSRYGFISMWDFLVAVFLFLNNKAASLIALTLILFPLILLGVKFCFENSKLSINRVFFILFISIQVLIFIVYGFESDIAQNIFCFIFLLLLTSDFIENKSNNKNIILFIYPLCIFFKLTSAPLIILYFFYLYHFKLFNFKNLLPLLLISLLIFAHNIMRSGCVLYPTSFSCFDFIPWSDKHTSFLEWGYIKSFDKEPFVGLLALMGYPWWKSNLFLNIIFPLLIIFIFQIFFILSFFAFSIQKEQARKKLNFTLGNYVIDYFTEIISNIKKYFWLLLSSLIAIIAFSYLSFSIRMMALPIAYFLSFLFLLIKPIEVKINFRPSIITIFFLNIYIISFIYIYNDSKTVNQSEHERGKVIFFLNKKKYATYNSYNELCGDIKFCGPANNSEIEKEKLFFIEYYKKEKNG